MPGTDELFQNIYRCKTMKIKLLERPYILVSRNGRKVVGTLFSEINLKIKLCVSHSSFFCGNEIRLIGRYLTAAQTAINSKRPIFSCVPMCHYFYCEMK